jgi:TRAP-type C4-dicarboxylate transport system permease small subunit
MEIESAAWFTKFRGAVTSISRWFERIGMIGMAAMVLVALIDVIGSKAFKWPLPGSTEITGVIQVVAISAGLGFSKIDGRHIRVGIFIDGLPKRGRAALEVFVSFLGLGLFAVAGWMTLQYGLSQLHLHTGTFLLGIIYYPFSLWISLSCIPIFCVILAELLSALDKVLK